MTAIKFKTITSAIELKSHTMHSYMEKEGKRITDAFDRIGRLLLLTSSEKPLHTKVVTWQGELKEWYQAEIEKFGIQKDKYLENATSNQAPDVEYPEYKYELKITHPCIWEVANIATELDSEINEIENMWLGGMINDEARTNSANRIVNIMRNIVSKIEAATAPGRNRQGGYFQAAQLVKLLRGGHELFVDGEKIDEQNKLSQQAQKQEAQKSKAPKQTDSSVEAQSDAA